MRLKLIRENTSVDFFSKARIWLGISMAMMFVAFLSFMIQGLNYGIDFQGGTSIRTQSEVVVDVGAYRDALEMLNLGDVSITEVFDPSFEANQNVAMVRIQAQEGQESVTNATITLVQDALRGVSSDMIFPSVESVGPKVSGELIKTAFIAVALAVIAILLYIWLRFEWQFAIGAVLALTHDLF